MKHIVSRGMMVALLAATGACSKNDDGSKNVADSMEVADGAGPRFSPTAAPGVAFDYRYRFGLQDAKITAAQEAHAAACEKLGADKCRITGMTFDLDERDRVSASLAVSIDAALARGFGKQAIGEVDRAGGRLRSAAIVGEDQQPTLDAAAAREVEAEGAANSIDTSLNETGQKFDRSVLRDQARQARNAALEAREQGAAARAKLTLTPMHFFYEGGGAGRGFAGSNPISDAWYLFIDSLATMIAVGLKGLALVLPWLTLLILGILAFRSRVGRRVRSWWTGTAGERYRDDQPI